MGKARGMGLGSLLGLAWSMWVWSCWDAAGAPLPEGTLQLRDRHGTFLGEIGGPEDERLGFWRLEAVPDRVAAATLAVEDRRFWHHPGVDALAIARATGQNLRSRDRISGASTLAMQVARLQRPRRRTWRAKLSEALTALLLVDRYGRDGVLRRYLTLAPYGNNVHGIAYAARRYFDRPVEDLSWAQTAILAGLPQAPGIRNLYDPAGRRAAVARAEHILSILAEDGVLSPVDHITAVGQLEGWAPPPRPVRPSSALHPVLALGRTLDDRDEGGLVPTHLDLALQDAVQKILADRVGAWARHGAGNAAALVVALPTLEVHAEVGSTGFTDDAGRGAIDFVRTPRQPGSTLKPLLYAHALDRGLITPATILDDLARGPDGIGNADGRFLGPLLVRSALGNSRNVPAVALARELGLQQTYGLFETLGLHDGGIPARHYGLGVAIGGMPTTLWDLATAYGSLATDGRLRPLRRLGTEDVTGTRIFSPASARWIGLALSDPMARLPSFPRLGHSEHPFGVAVKTGTSPDFRDAWAVAYSSRWLVAVWVGHPDWRPMRGLSGYRAGAALTHEILSLLEADRAAGFADHRLPAPEGWVSTPLCPISGRLPTAACPTRVTEVLHPSDVPVQDCTVHQRTGDVAMLDLPARYAEWIRTSTYWTPVSTPIPGTVDLALVAPLDGAVVTLDPDVPADRSTLRLAVEVTPAVPQVVWYVDGDPHAVVGPPYVVRWPVTPGVHTFEVGLPFRDQRSAPVSVSVSAP